MPQNCHLSSRSSKRMETIRNCNKVFPASIPKNGVILKDPFAGLDFGLTKQGVDGNKTSESLKALRPFLRWYQVLGFLQIHIGENDTSVWTKNRSPLRFLSCVSLFIQGTMAVRTFLEVLQNRGKNTSKRVDSINNFVYYLHTLTMTIILIRRIPYFPSLIEACKRVERVCKKYQRQNDHLVKHCWILFTVLLFSQFVGNGLYYYSLVKKHNVTSVSGFSLIYELESEKSFGEPWTAGLGIVYSIFEFYCDCGWTFGDTLIALTSLVLTRFCTRLNLGISSSQALTVEEVEQLRKDHRSIKDLVEQCNFVFSPIFLVNYMGNVSYLLTRMYTGVSDDFQHPTNIIIKVEAIYAFIYQVLKILVPTMLASQLNEKATEAIDTVHDWSSLIDHPRTRDRMMVISRFVSQIIHDPVALSGCGYFTITKSFVVTLISRIITYEVIILQFQQSSGL